MTSRQERERLKVLEKRRKEHGRYAAERLAKVNEICALACKHGMSYGKYMIEMYDFDNGAVRLEFRDGSYPVSDAERQRFDWYIGKLIDEGVLIVK